jgi:hypothetical protein
MKCLAGEIVTDQREQRDAYRQKQHAEKGIESVLGVQSCTQRCEIEWKKQKTAPPAYATRGSRSSSEYVGRPAQSIMRL